MTDEATLGKLDANAAPKPSSGFYVSSPAVGFRYCGINEEPEYVQTIGIGTDQRRGKTEEHNIPKISFLKFIVCKFYESYDILKSV